MNFKKTLFKGVSTIAKYCASVFVAFTPCTICECQELGSSQNKQTRLAELIKSDTDGGFASAKGGFTTPPLTFIVVVDISGSMLDQFPAPIQPDLAYSEKLADVKRRLSLLAQYLPNNTRVIVTAFDHESFEICDLVLSTAEKRRDLKKHFSSIESRNGSTFLWKTAIEGLTKAVEIANDDKESSRVRMLLYTDGNDEDPSEIDHTTVIEKFGDFLQTAVQLDVVTIGFDLESNVKTALQEHGVDFKRANSAADVVPLSAAFKLSKDKLMVGEEVRLFDQSIGVDITSRIADFGDGSKSKRGDALTHTYSKPGVNTVRYWVVSKTGRKSAVVEEKVSVAALPALKLKIAVANTEITIGESIIAKDESTTDAVYWRWQFAGQEYSGSQVELWPKQVGTHMLVLTVKDEYGRQAQSSVAVTVGLPPAPSASFRFSADVAKPGDRVALINETEVAKLQWTVDGKVLVDKHPTIVIDGYHDVHVRLDVWDHHGQQQSVSKTLRVPVPAKPTVNFVIPDLVQRNTELVVEHETTGVVDSDGHWYFNDVLIGTGRVLRFRPKESGALKLVGSGPGGSSEHICRVNLADHAKPIADFTIGNPKPFCNETIRITSIASMNAAEQVEYFVSWLPQQRFLFTRDEVSEQPWFDVKCSKVGTQSIIQRVVGPGGESEAERQFEVVTRAQAPELDFDVSKTSGRGATTVTFVNKCKHVDRIEFDPGNGEPTQSYEGWENIAATYEPGDWTAIIRGYPKDGEPFDAGIWTSPAIKVAKPRPAWVKNLMWQIPLGAVGLAMLFASGLFVCSRRELRELAQIGGHLSVREKGKPRIAKTFDFEGVSTEETIEVGVGVLMKISSYIQDQVIQYQLELKKDGKQPKTFGLQPDGEDIKVGEFIVSYSA